MNKIIMSVFFLMIGCLPVIAVDINDSMRGVQVDLEQTLFSLKESIAKLSLENEEISRANVSLREQIKIMGESLRKLEQEAKKQEQEYQAIQEKDKQQRAPLKELEAKVFQLDEMIVSLDEEFKQQGDLIKSQESEESRLFAVASVLSDQVQKLRVELTQTMKTTNTSEKVDRHQLARDLMTTEENLKKTQEEWVLLQELLQRDQSKLGDFRTENTAIQTKIEEVSVDLEELKMTLKNLESFIRKFSGSDQENLKTVVELEKDIQQLTQEIILAQSNVENHTMVAGASKNKAIKLKESEMNRLQTLYYELEKENSSLRLELKQLRQTMVDLDKKRTFLENKDVQ